MKTMARHWSDDNSSSGGGSSGRISSTHSAKSNELDDIALCMPSSELLVSNEIVGRG